MRIKGQGGAGGTTPLSWRRFLLGGAPDLDTESTFDSLAEDATESLVAVNGSTVSANIQNAAVWHQTLTDADGNALDFSEPWEVRICLLMTTEPSATSDLYVVTGIGEGAAAMAAGVYVYGGLYYDAAGGPDILRGHDGGSTTSAPNPNADGGHIHMIRAPFDSEWEYLGWMTMFSGDTHSNAPLTTLPNSLPDLGAEPSIFVAVGQPISQPADSIGFRVYYFATNTLTTWRPTG